MSDVLKGTQRDYGGPTIADGIAVKKPGVLTRGVIDELVDDILVIDEPVLEAAVQMLLTSQQVLAEGATPPESPPSWEHRSGSLSDESGW